jgi:hypothetical protein
MLSLTGDEHNMQIAQCHFSYNILTLTKHLISIKPWWKYASHAEKIQDFLPRLLVRLQEF